jgi:hypothetical protein
MTAGATLDDTTGQAHSEKCDEASGVEIIHDLYQDMPPFRTDMRTFGTWEPGPPITRDNAALALQSHL